MENIEIPPAIKIYFIPAIILAVFLGLGYSLNNIVIRHESITAGWAQVENQLQRRFDLIPNLVNTVKAYAQHEKSLFEDITNARSQWAHARTVKEKIKAANSSDALLSRLLMVVENYPGSKLSPDFLQLMDELSGVENRIAVERTRYNSSVKSYNIIVRTFPGNIIAIIFGYKPETEYYKAQE